MLTLLIVRKKWVDEWGGGGNWAEIFVFWDEIFICGFEIVAFKLKYFLFKFQRNLQSGVAIIISYVWLFHQFFDPSPY